MAFVLCHPSARLWAAARVPEAAVAWARPRRTQISLWELVAAVCSVQILIDRGLQDCEVVLFIDSNVALHTLVRGASRQDDYNAVVADFWFEVATAAILLHAVRVPSRLNLADGPTRQSTFEPARAELAGQGFQEVDWRWPKKLPWQAEL